MMQVTTAVSLLTTPQGSWLDWGSVPRCLCFVLLWPVSFALGPKDCSPSCTTQGQRERGLTPGIPSQPLRSPTLNRPGACSLESLGTPVV